MNPKKLLQIFLFISILGTLIILSSSYWGMGYVLNKYNTESAQLDALNIGHILFQIEHDTLVDPATDKLWPIIPTETFTSFDKRMRALLSPMNIIKVKIFSPEELIIYSTDHQLIGQIDNGNVKLEQALKGQVVSDLKRKESVTDLSDETQFNIDVIETYVPMSNQDDNIIGAYEVYLNITPYRLRIESTIQIQTLMIFGLLLMIFTALSIVMWRGTQLLSEIQNKLQHRASRDALTNLFNRGYLSSRLEEELARVQRGETARENYHAGIILIDIDFFKQVNDEFGHLIGDQVLIELSKRLHSLLRNQDIIGRYGGEEFLVILPMTGTLNTLSLAERLHRGIKATPLMINNVQYHITASLGVSNLVCTDNSIDDVLSRADTALYQVKESGRDQIAAVQFELCDNPLKPASQLM